MGVDNHSDIDLPDDSIFDKDDFLRMSVIASGQIATDILEILGQNGSVPKAELASKLRYDDEEVASTLKDLQRVALVRQGWDPDFGRYFAITELGQVILDGGVEEGVDSLAQSEHDIEERYRRD